MRFDAPIPFSAAVDQLEAKGLLPTDLRSADLRLLDAELRERSVFSARTTALGALQRIKTLTGDLLNGTTNMATARLKLQQMYDALGYSPEEGFPGDEGAGIPPAEAGSLRDLSSNKRTGLVLETQTRQVANRALQVAGSTDFALYAWPCWEMLRIYPRRVPRGEEMPTPGEGWPERWEQCGGLFYDGLMIARKDSDIWPRLGDSSRFEDALDTDIPPFAFGSGYGWRAVPREEAVARGVIEASTDITGKPSQRARAAEAAADFDPEFLRALRDQLNVQIADGKARLQISRTLSAPALQLAPLSDFGGIL